MADDSVPAISPPGSARAPRAGIVGFALGSALGTTFGLAYPHWGPMLAVGAPTWLMGLAIGSIVGGLAGIFASLSAEPVWFSREHEWKAHSRRSLLVGGSVAVAAAILVVLVSLVLSERIVFPTGEPSSGRVHWLTKNTSRLGAEDPAETAAQVAHAVFPADPPDAVLLVSSDPVAFAAAAPMIRVLNAPILLLEADGSVPSATARLLERWPRARVVAVGAQPLPTLSERAVETVTGASPEQLFAATNALLEREGVNERPTIALGGGPDQLLPAAAWLAHAPSPIAWQTGGGYAFIGEDAAPEVGDAVRVGASDPVEHALALATFRDEGDDVGWGALDTPADTWRNAIVANPESWQQAGAGLALAAFGKPGPLLWTSRDAIPRPLESALWRGGPEFELTPAEGPFNHVWILGTLEDVSYGQQGRLDWLVEMAPLQTQGPGTSWVEFWVLTWMLAALISALWVLFDAVTRLPSPWFVKISWFLSTLVLGPIGAWLYVKAHRGRPLRTMHGMVMWERPMWLQVAVAWSRSIAAGTLIMVVTSAFVFFYGAPLVPNDFAVILGNNILGNHMLVTMFTIAYVVALIVGVALLMTPQMQHHRMMQSGDKPSYVRAFPMALANMAINMTVLTVFMFTGMWIWMMEFFQMGDAQEAMFWWYALLIGVALGVAAIYPVNWWMVARNRRGGLS